MKKSTLLVAAWIASLIVAPIHAMDQAPVEPTKTSPTQAYTCWLINQSWAPQVKIILKEKTEHVWEKTLDTSSLLVDKLIVFIECASIECTSDSIDIIPFRLPEDTNQISFNHVDEFCNLLSENAGSSIAVCGAENDTNMYLMLACAYIQGLIKDGFAQNSPITLIGEHGSIICKFREIRTADEYIKNLVVSTLINAVYSILFHQYAKNTIPSCFSLEKNGFDDLIRKFCKRSLNPIIGRKASSGERIRRSSSATNSPRKFSPSLGEFHEGPGSPQNLKSLRGTGGSSPSNIG